MNLVGSRLGDDIHHPSQRLPILCRVRAGLYAELLDGFGTGARDTAAAGAVRVLENIEVHPAGIGAIHQEVQPAFLPERARAVDALLRRAGLQHHARYQRQQFHQIAPVHGQRIHLLRAHHAAQRCRSCIHQRRVPGNGDRLPHRPRLQFDRHFQPVCNTKCQAVEHFNFESGRGHRDAVHADRHHRREEITIGVGQQFQSLVRTGIADFNRGVRYHRARRIRHCAENAGIVLLRENEWRNQSKEQNKLRERHSPLRA